MSTALRRATPIVFAIADGRKFRIAPPSRGAMREALALDPQDESSEASPRRASARRARQLAALIGGTLTTLPDGAQTASAPILAALTPGEETRLFTAIVAQGSAEKQPARPQRPRRPVPLADRLAAFDRDTLNLAVHLQRSATEAEHIEFIESLLLLETLYERDADRMKFEAALHGAKLG